MIRLCLIFLLFATITLLIPEKEFPYPEIRLHRNGANAYFYSMNSLEKFGIQEYDSIGFPVNSVISQENQNEIVADVKNTRYEVWCRERDIK